MHLRGICLLALLLVGCGEDIPNELLGPYRMEDGSLLSIRPSAEGTLRYRDLDTGRSGRLYPVDALDWEGGAGFSDHEPVAIRVHFELGQDGRAQTLRWLLNDGSSQRGERVGSERWVAFENEGAKLQGRLSIPEGDGPFPAVVLVHGSGKAPGSQWFYIADFFVGNGIAVLAYDKRGTGKSSGEFTMDYRLLARDVVAGVEYLRTQPEIDGARIGASGYSQGGWIAPLASSLTDLRFVIVNYGMIESPTYEARTEMRQKLEDAEIDGAELDEAMQVVDAAVAVVAGGFQEGWDDFDRLKKQHEDAAWRPALEGTPVHDLMRYPKWAVKLIGPRKAPKGLDWNYDSTQLLRESCTPMTWLLGGADSSAPNEETIPKLRQLQAAGKPLDLTIYDGAEHGMLVVEEIDGQLIATGYADGYWQDQIDAAWKWFRERPECPQEMED